MFRGFIHSYLVEDVNGDEYRDQIVTRLHSVVEACLCIHCSCSSVMAHLHIVMYPPVHQYQNLFTVLFLQSLFILFNSKNFSFTCLHSFFTCFQQMIFLLSGPLQNVAAYLPVPIPTCGGDLELLGICVG